MSKDGMTIDAAIKGNKEILKDEILILDAHSKSIRLGVEALERMKLIRMESALLPTDELIAARQPLPSEMEGDKGGQP